MSVILPPNRDRFSYHPCVFKAVSDILDFLLSPSYNYSRKEPDWIYTKRERLKDEYVRGLDEGNSGLTVLITAVVSAITLSAIIASSGCEKSATAQQDEPVYYSRTQQISR